jgi:hypothetical protein
MTPFEEADRRLGGMHGYEAAKALACMREGCSGVFRPLPHSVNECCDRCGIVLFRAVVHS